MQDFDKRFAAFDKRFAAINKSADRTAFAVVTLWLLGLTLWLSAVGGIVWTIIHFARKFW